MGCERLKELLNRMASKTNKKKPRNDHKGDESGKEKTITFTLKTYKASGDLKKAKS